MAFGLALGGAALVVLFLLLENESLRACPRSIFWASTAIAKRRNGKISYYKYEIKREERGSVYFGE